MLKLYVFITQTYVQGLLYMAWTLRNKFVVDRDYL